MKQTQSIYILLSLFLMFSCEDNSVEPLVCDEGLTNVDGVCQLCSEEYTEIDGECYFQSDLDVLQDIIDVNESLSGQEPLEIGNQIWTDGRLTLLNLSDNQLTTFPESIGNLSSLEGLYLSSNLLSSLPSTICNLPSSCYIRVSNNCLSDAYLYSCLNYYSNQNGSECSP